MENDPDPDAMSNRPKIDADDDVELQDMTVTEGGASGGLFVADDSDDDDAIAQARLAAQIRSDDDSDENSDDYAGQQLQHMSRSEDEDDEDMEDEQDADDGDDPIVKTYEICATKILAEHLYLFQYPIRSANRPYESSDLPSEARMKPRTGHVQIDIPILESNYYDNQRAVQWTDDPLKVQTLGGNVAPSRNYLIGLVRGDQLHVTALKGVAQLRPVFKYIDEHDREEREAKRSDASAEKGAKAPKAVQMSAKSSDALPDLSTTALIRAAEEENWTKLHWRESSHKESENVFKHLITTKPDTLCNPLTDKAAYLDMLSTIKTETAVPSKTKKESK
ncbi:protein of unknown function [Taphrina deformans PYCC 5710]|uniref:Uncharacterized protein n=1 Tax=Taphrina deformans (strain PYCC 5710 / ATCC 11124 / CBS 356.35 / IMI 108563 / JCM 9778 / NBRC 8474) TaxID=1097556 RepID=R4XID4_TAPDE|nr:protein of unknown function [Taphrina deformans PYCC 5710]|eukprot:CCG84264.1 protein of unknown function [Taphrina deformans PYCC 5710]